MQPLERAEEAAKALGRKIAEGVPKGWGFVLILANYEAVPEKGRMTYLSNCDRSTIPTMLREMASMLETNKKQL